MAAVFCRACSWIPRRRATVGIFLVATLVLLTLLIGAHHHAPSVASADESDAARTPLGAQMIRGVNHAHVHRGNRGYGSARSAETLSDLRRLGVNWIAINPLAYQRRVNSDRLRGFPAEPGEAGARDDNDPSMADDDLAREIAAAHERGLKVLIKPHVWSRDFWGGSEWHGSIDQDTPQARRRWWRSYRQCVLHYARLAAAHGADGLCLGTELVKMTEGARRQRQWRELIAEVRAIYEGPLTYAAHWEEEFSRIDFWDALDAIGVASYFPLEAPADASVAQLVEAWRPHRARMARVQRRFEKPLVFLEAGYRPVAATHREPWRHNGGEFDEAAQARAYRAMFVALSDEPWWRGVFLWKTFTDPRRGQRGGPSFAFHERPAEQVVRQWYDGERQ